jgi:alginate O-acetyltransferase complex protein AlgI
LLFNSPEFLFLFLPATLVCFVLAHRLGPTAPQVVLVIASTLFYAWWSVDFVVVLAASLITNYWIGQRLCDRPSRSLLAAGVLLNLAMLCYFKYTDFGITIVNTLFDTNWPLLHIALPLGLSFWIFQKIAWLADCHAGQVQDKSLLRFSLFVTLFPALIAGPITHHKEIMPQFAANAVRRRLPEAQMVAQGIAVFVLGMAKKVIIADTFARYADPAFASAHSVTFYEAWIGLLAYTLQIYFDFSGYSEMAMGLASLFGIRLPLNFNAPLKSRSISEFWQRWHMSLGTWLKAYLYIPLGGSRHGLPRTIVAAFITMLLGGLWHGAGAQYALWGMLHGAYLGIQKTWSAVAKPLPGIVAHALTFAAVMLAWVLFRAPSVADAWSYYHALFGLNGIVLPAGFQSVLDLSFVHVDYASSSMVSGAEAFLVAIALIVVLRAPTVHQLIATRIARPQYSFALAGLATVSLFMLGDTHSFIYFIF